MKKTELLAPAKDKQTAIEAINCGADAVYMGASDFGARKNASNPLCDIKEVVDYAHKFWAKVFVTINTILSDKELDEAIELIKNLDKLGVDAIIIQDMGLLEKIIILQQDEANRISIPIHISTQCDNREEKKVNFFNNIGVSRVVLARELSLDKIKEIHLKNPDLELEAFIHGALCVSYSGQCYLSQYIGGRSANRGECAQPCRKTYNVETQNGKVLAEDVHALCLKDFNASKHLEKMVENGVFSFKIEGRLKETNYVKNVTAFYRQELDKFSRKISSGKSIYPFAPNPEKSFNRGFTDYFLEGRKECFNFVSPKSRGEFLGEVIGIYKDYFTIKTDKEIHPQDGLVIGTDGCLVNKYIKNNELIHIYPNKKLDIKSKDKVFRNLDVEFEKDLSKQVKRQIGVSVYVKDNELILIDEDNITLSSVIPSTEKAQNQAKMNETFEKQFSKTGESDFYIEKFEINSDIPFMPVSEINKLRRDAFSMLMGKRLENYKREVGKKLHYAPYYKHELDFRANVHNDSAEKFYNKCGAKVLERSLESENIKRLIELMRTKHCIKYALGMCKSKENLVLSDKHGSRYALKFDCKNCEMIVLSN